MDNYSNNLNNVSILLIGAGGIGCEVIKNLMLNGVKKLTIVDMDTIDVSNLNRQFLYLPEHVNKYKAEVAKERALELNPYSEVISLVCDVNLWKPNDMLKYDVVLNALDNIKARSHINYCCIQSGVPLIESGSTGYNGQVYPILKDVTKCYECDPLPKTKSIPVCSIRQIPEKPTHCIAWARMLYQLLFGTPDNNNLLTDLSVPNLPDLNNIDETKVIEYLNNIFNFLFNSEIETLLKMEEVWINKDPPKPLTYKFNLKRKIDNNNIEDNKEIKENKNKKIKGRKKQNQNDNTNDKEHIDNNSNDSNNTNSSNSNNNNIVKNSKVRRNKFAVLEFHELCEQFANSIKEILLNETEIIGNAVFSKDDEICIEFVSASANLRMINFGIKQLSTWEVQSIAGSIVPAIASTNAIVAAFQVIQLMHLLNYLKRKENNNNNTNSSNTNDNSNNIEKENNKKNEYKDIELSECRKVWIKSNVMGSNPLKKGKLSQPEILEPPNPKCTTCQQKSYKVRVRSIDLTLNNFVTNVFYKSMGLELVSIDYNLKNIYDGGEFEDDQNYANNIKNNKLSFYDINDSSILTVTDLNNDLQFEVVIQLEPNLDTDFQVL